MFNLSSLFGQVSNGILQDVVVCGESEEWEVTTNSAGILIIENLPPGYCFDGMLSSTCGATMISNNPPTFEVPSACSIIYLVHAECEAFIVRDENQGGDPNLNFSITFSWNGTALPSLDITAETNAPELKLEMINNGSPVSPFTDFSRRIRICNDGLDSYIDYPIEVCFDNGNDLLVNSVFLDDGLGGILLPISGANCVTIGPTQFQYALDRSNLPTGTDPFRFEGSSSSSSNTAECLFLDLDIRLNSCDQDGDFTQDIYTNWGCNGQECALASELVTNANISFEVPNLTISGDLVPGDGCNLEHLFSEIITITNTGNGTADNVMIHVEPRFRYTALSAFDIDDIVLNDGINPPTIIPGILDRAANMTTAGDKAFCDQLFTDLGGGTAAASFDIELPISIAAGQSIEIEFPVFFCCSNDCSDTETWDRWFSSVEYTNTCNTDNFIIPLTLIQNWFFGENKTSPVFPPDLNDGDLGSIDLDITNFNLDNHYAAYDWPIKAFYVLNLPCGLIFDGNIQSTISTGEVFTPDSISWDPMTGELYFDWEQPFPNGSSREWEGGKIEFDVLADCAPCGGGPKTISVEEGYSLGSECNTFCTIERCYNFQIQIHCGDCPWPGITPDSYEIVRTNYGFEDLDDNGVPDSGAKADPSDIRINRAIVGDTLEGSWHANVTTNAEHPFWEFAYAQTTMSGMTATGYTEPVGGRIEVIDVSTGATLVCDHVPSSIPSIGIADFDFSPATLCAAGCADFCGFVFEDGDEINLTGIFVVKDDNICRNQRLSPITVTTELYGAEQANPPENTVPQCSTCDPVIFPDNRWTCDFYSGAWTLLTPFVTIATSQNLSVLGCDEVRLQNGFYWGIGPGVSYHFNLFDNEYRPFGIWDTVYVAIPQGYTVIDWDLTNSRGNGSGATSENLNGIQPDFIDSNPVGGAQGSTTYGFVIKQYYDNGDFLISDDGGIVFIYPTVIASCDTPPETTDTIQYWGTPLWLNNNQECDIFGPQAHDVLTYFPPDLELQSDNKVVQGDCPIAEWPLRVLGLNNEDAENVWLYFPPSTIQIEEVLDNNGDQLVESNGFYQVGDVAGPSSQDFQINASYITCDVDSILVLLGYDCNDYPTSIFDVEDSCLDSIWLTVEPALPAFNLAIIQPDGSVNVDLCEEVSYEFQYKNIGDSKGYSLRSFIYLPISNVEITPGSLEIEYPCGSGYQTWHTSYPTIFPQPLGTLLRFDVSRESRLNTTIGEIGTNINGWAYPNISEVDNCFNIRFDVNTACGFEAAGGFIRTLLRGRGPCGLPSNDPNAVVFAAIENAGSLNINGVEPYDLGMSASMDPVLFTCADNQSLDIELEMLDSGSTEPTDSIKVNIPFGFSYVSDNSGLMPDFIFHDSMTTIIYPIDPPLSMGDQMSFSIDLALDDDELDCGEANLSVRTTTIDQTECIQNPGVLCDVGVYTAQQNIFVEIDKPSMEVQMISAIAACSSADLPTDVAIEIENTSTTSINDFEVEVYANLDGSCSLLGDNILVGTIPISTAIAAGQLTTVLGTFDIPANACQLISTLRGCVCENASSSCIDVVMEVNEPVFFETCHNEPIHVETCLNPELTYSWEPIGASQLSWLDDVSIFNPTITIPNTTGNNLTFDFEVSLDRGNICRVLDTITVMVFSLEESTDPIALEFCTNQIGALSAPNGLSGTWSPSTNVFDINDPNSILLATPSAESMIYTFTYNDANGCEAFFNQMVEIVECVDVALEKDLSDPPTPINMGDVIQFELTVTNQSLVDATNVVVQDSLPACLEYAGDGTISIGSLINDSNRNLTWNVGDLTAGESLTAVIDVKVIRIGSCLNTAQVKSHDQKDLDSDPDNDDGDQSEDDEDGVSFDACKAGVCLPVNIIKN